MSRWGEVNVSLFSSYFFPRATSLVGKDVGAKVQDADSRRSPLARTRHNVFCRSSMKVVFPSPSGPMTADHRGYWVCVHVSPLPGKHVRWLPKLSLQIVAERNSPGGATELSLVGYRCVEFTACSACDQIFSPSFMLIILFSNARNSCRVRLKCAARYRLRYFFLINPPVISGFAHSMSPS